MEFHQRIAQGLEQGVHRHWRFAKNLVQIKPEYLLTVSVADALTEGIAGFHGIDLTIKLEEPTGSICFNLLSNAVGLREFIKRKRHKVERRGKVDIFVEHERNCWIIELKGFDPSAVEINKDLFRLVQFLSANSWNNKCLGACLAFPTLVDAQQRLERMVAAQLGDAPMVVATVYANRVETDEDPEDGIPVYFTNCISLVVSPCARDLAAEVTLAATPALGLRDTAAGI